MNQHRSTTVAVTLAASAFAAVILPSSASAAGPGSIAFERYTPAEPIENIAVVSATGGAVSGLTNSQATSDITPDIAPDGSNIVLARAGAATDGIWTMHPDGTGLGSVPTNADGVSPAWSPDGTRLVYTRGWGQASELFLVDADGANPLQVTRNRVGETAPRWSPDGGSLVFARTNSTGSASAIVTLDLGTGLSHHVTGYTHLDSAPDWSVKGEIVFSRYLGGGDSDLYTIDPNGTDLTQLTSGPLQDNHPDFAPNGNAVAFSRGGADESDNAHIFRVAKNGQQLTQITFGDVFDYFPSWGAA